MPHLYLLALLVNSLRLGIGFHRPVAAFLNGIAGEVAPALVQAVHRVLVIRLHLGLILGEADIGFVEAGGIEAAGLSQGSGNFSGECRLLPAADFPQNEEQHGHRQQRGRSGIREFTRPALVNSHQTSNSC